jgi:hypothetical protein
MPEIQYTAISEDKHKLYASISSGVGKQSAKRMFTVEDIKSCTDGNNDKVWRNQGLVDLRTKTIHHRLSRKLAIRENVTNLVKLMDKVDQTDPEQKRLYGLYATRKAGLEQMLLCA